ncbi:MAG: erythromycin esterase family protein, partial [Candidatus Aminicenantes bacterium]|nr:erythromycin esterase family protein [Candidatus Aminicenantes bacterium]
PAKTFFAIIGMLLVVNLIIGARKRDGRQEKFSQNIDSKDVEAVTQWIEKNAIPLESIAAGHGFKDLEPFGDILKDVRVVGLGEATHGSREFFQFKHRMLEFLVEKLGFRIFAIEASYAGCNNINAYVLHGKGDPAEALASQKFWTWDTQEVRDMIAWMRQYNTKLPDEKKVQFLGYDLQHLEQGMDFVESYISQHIPEYSETVSSAMKPLRIDPFSISELPKASPEEKARILSELHEMMGILAFHEVPLIRESSAEEYALALQNARVITQYYTAYSKAMMGSDPAESAAALRDFYMAENIEYIMNSERPDARIVVWAHNGHISNSVWGMNFPAMGSHLKKILGEAYYALGFAFNRGSFQARLMDPESDQNGALIEFTVGPAPEGSVEWFLAKSGIDNFIIDLRRAPENGPIHHWLTSVHPLRFIGAAFSEKFGDKQFMVPTVLMDHFDGVAFFGRTSRARPNPTGERGPYKQNMHPVKKN